VRTRSRLDAVCFTLQRSQYQEFEPDKISGEKKCERSEERASGHLGLDASAVGFALDGEDNAAASEAAEGGAAAGTAESAVKQDAASCAASILSLAFACGPELLI
jgi:hypothetical protein